jgi:hypothetical protein
MKRKPKSKRSQVKTKLGLPDLEHAKVAVIVSLRSFESQRTIGTQLMSLWRGIAPPRDCRSTKRSSSDIDCTLKTVTSLLGP